jgi:hypothetical protein
VFALDRFGGPSAQPASTVLTEAGPNAVATFRLDGRGALIPVAQALTGQTATCWITVVNGRLYLSNAGSGNVSAFTSALAPIGLTSGRVVGSPARNAPDRSGDRAGEIGAARDANRT